MSKKIPDKATQSIAGALSAVESKIHGLDIQRSQQFAHINLKYIQTDYECFSQWSSDELKDFSSLINKLSQITWDTLFKSGGKPGSKTGLGMTYLPKELFPKNPALDRVSKDLDLFELRVNEKVRVHGFRSINAFFLVYLDREHRICS